MINYVKNSVKVQRRNMECHYSLQCNKVEMKREDIMRTYPKFYITKKGERAARSGHPWVYGEEVTRTEGRYANGDLVDVVTI